MTSNLPSRSALELRGPPWMRRRIELAAGALAAGIVADVARRFGVDPAAIRGTGRAHRPTDLVVVARARAAFELVDAGFSVGDLREYGLLPGMWGVHSVMARLGQFLCPPDSKPSSAPSKTKSFTASTPSRPRSSSDGTTGSP